MIGNKDKSSHKWIHPNGVKFLIIALLVLGVFFRFVNLDKKVYWGDEVFTSLRIAGYTLTEATQELFNNKPKTLAELHQYQQPRPDKGITDTIKSLAAEDSQHPPLYYIIAHYWEKLFGSELAVKRSLPALISLLAFPGIYFLCWELFNSPMVGWVAVTIVAVSPFHVLYAQEVREYSLWTVTILLSSWLLLRAMRLNTKFSWIIYAASLPLLLYTYLFSILIAIGQAIYVFVSEGWRWHKKQIAFLFASSFGLLTFTPWLWIVVNSLSSIQSTTSQFAEKVDLRSLLQIWSFNLSRVFIDLDSQGKVVNFGNPIAVVIRVAVILSIAILVGYSIYFICDRTPKRVWLFILTLMGVTGLALILPDLIVGGIRSGVPRYLVPCYLGIQLAVAYTIFMMCYAEIFPHTSYGNTGFDSGGIFSLGINSKKFSHLWRSIALAMLSVGVLSCTISSQAESWWNKYGSYYNPEVARIINQHKSPLVISSGYVPRVLSLSYFLQPEVKIQFIPQANISQIPPGFTEVFLYRPSAEKLKYRRWQQLNYKIETVYRSPPIYDYLEPISRHSDIWIWKLTKRS
ncbi:glycosyltransferase family 39 protein [Aerosakkonema funiforme]|uniref:glycosyltransferase family 39 protein n=2 Tax=Oscillatoriophycideae TaxID=1301283 RepID=UPI0018EF4307|nr:glycosyltransferase family 39 protein [Aerosakkonema funiforme]